MDPNSQPTPPRSRRRAHTDALLLFLLRPRQVRSIELGSNTSNENRSRSHSLGLLVTFDSHGQRSAYLRSAERAEFAAFADPFVAEWFVFDFESGGVV